MKRLIKFLFCAFLIIFAAESVWGQNFGRNRVIYEDFDFRIYKTPNFEIYHYLEDETELDEFARLCERWYKRHLEIFLDTLDERSPIILYKNHADFQQTTVVDQLMGIGTGGVTEGMRQRVVMPLSSSRRDTDHVLGHELTHVFHFRIFTGRRGTGQIRYSMQNVPLWMTEGQSEYLSIGSSDVQTAMWMRDAVKHNDIPTLTDMTERMHEYFPYRWGHAFWAFFASTYGDDMVLPLYTSSAMMGYERAIDTLTGIPADSLSVIWAENLRKTFEPLIVGRNLQDYTVVDDEFEFEDYDPGLSLEAIGGMGVGAGVSRFGAGMAGGVSLFFGDMLREHRLITAVQAEGRIIDIAGQVMYLNQTSRFNWGGAFSHMPYRSAYSFMRMEEVNGTPVQNLIMIEQRVFEQELGAIGQYPLSRQQRFEGGISGSLYSFRVDSINNYFIGNRLVERDEYRLDAPESFFLSRLYLAFVGDGSVFGFTSPMRGYRYRFQAARTVGRYGFWGLTADYRQYRFFSPLAIGFRVMHHGRYGRDADQIRPLYVGNPYFVRGYSFRHLHRQADRTRGVFGFHLSMGGF